MPLPTSFAGAVRAAAEATTIRELADGAVAKLASAIGASSYFFGAEQASSGRFLGELGEVVPAYLAEWVEHDPNRVAKLAHPHPVLQHSHKLDSSYARSPVYNEFFRRFDLEHFVSVRLFDTPNPTGPMTIMFARGRSVPDFESGTVSLLTRALAVLNAAVWRVQKNEETLGAASSIRTSTARAQSGAYVAVDDAGQILWLSSRADALLASRFSLRGRLPYELVGAARRLGAFVRGDGSASPDDLVHELALPPLDGGADVTARLAIARTALGSPFVEINLQTP